jgi:hypothetical protein
VVDSIFGKYAFPIYANDNHLLVIKC